MKRRLPALAVSIAFALWALPAAADQWSSGCLGYVVDFDGSPKRSIDYQTASDLVRQGFLTWLAADCGGGRHPALEVYDLGPTYCGVREYHPKTGNANAWLFRDDSWPYPKTNDVYALTFARVDENGAIHDADVEINSAEYAFSTDGAKGVDLASVIVHEAGHVIGLEHSANEETVMFDNYTGRRELHPDDVAAICALYPPDAPVTSCNYEPDNGLFRECGESEVVAQGCSITRVPGHEPVVVTVGFCLGLLLGARRVRR